MDLTSGVDRQVYDIAKAYGGSILRLAWVYVKNRPDAEDIAQDVLVAYIEKMPATDNADHLKAWLMQVTRNKCLDFLKSGWKKRTAELTDDLSYMPPEKSSLLEHVMNLEEKYRLPVHLHYYEGYSIKEIAHLMGHSPATIGTWLARGRSKLRAMIGGEWLE